MLKVQSIVEKHQAIIKKVFNAYCHKQNLHLSTAARNLLFKKLLLNIKKNWETTYAKCGNAILEDSLVIELVRLGCKKLFKDSHAEDVRLLHSEADKLILKYQPIIHHIVYKQSQKGEMVDDSFQADLIANIQAKLLQKAKSGKLTAQFKGDSLFSTYFYKVTYHTMIDEWRKIKRHKMDDLSSVTNSKHEVQHNTTSNLSDYAYLIEQHLQRYKTLLNMLPSKRLRRFEFAIKILYKMKLVVADIRASYANCEDELLVEILSYFSKSYHNLSKAQIFVLIGEFLSALEKIPVNSDSFRIWFQNTLSKVKKAVFKGMPDTDKKTLDAYFEFLIYKFYKKH